MNYENEKRAAFTSPEWREPAEKDVLEVDGKAEVDGLERRLL
jgi:hypothetical protein